MRRLILLTALALLAAGAGLVAAQPRQAAPARAAAVPAITIRGHVSGLYPGASKLLSLKLRNRSRRDLLVTSIRARVLDAGDRCPARNLKTTERGVRRPIPGRSTRRVGYRVAMIAHASNGCQDARFPLRYRAEVRRR